MIAISEQIREDGKLWTGPRGTSRSKQHQPSPSPGPEVLLNLDITWANSGKKTKVWETAWIAQFGDLLHQLFFTQLVWLQGSGGQYFFQEHTKELNSHENGKKRPEEVKWF